MHVLLRCCFSFSHAVFPLPDGSPWHQLCHSAASRHRAPASSISATAAPLASSIFPMAFRRSAPASNKPHPAEKSTPVWLAIWRTWAGFANSQLRRTTLHSTYSYIYPSPLLPPWNRCSDRRKSFGPSAPIAYATSVSPPNEAIAWLGRRY